MIQFPAPTTTCEWHVYAWGLRYFPDERGRLKVPRKFPGHVIRLGQWLVDPAHMQIYMVTVILHAGTDKKEGIRAPQREAQTDRKTINHPVGETTCRACWVETLLSAWLFIGRSQRKPELEELGLSLRCKGSIVFLFELEFQGKKEEVNRGNL